MQSGYHVVLFAANKILCIFLLFLTISDTHAFTVPLRQTPPRPALTRQHAAEVAAASLLAGSLAGAIGVGVAHPLDTLNIKTQVLQAATSLKKLNAQKAHTISVIYDQGENAVDSLSFLQQERIETKNSSAAINPVLRSFSTALQATASAVTPNSRFPSRSSRMNNYQQLLSPLTTPGGDRTFSTDKADGVSSDLYLVGIEENGRVNTWNVMRQVYENEGIAGFLGGIRIMMLGQALVKACSFTVNSLVLNWEVAHASSQTDSPTTAMFLIAAASAGFASSFIVNPVERVKILLQAASDGNSHSEAECIQQVLKSEGWSGFLGRGLGTTMLREIPSDAIYFSVYGLLMQAVGGGVGGTEESMLLAPWLASLLFGAASGVASWIPVYPVDLVKTLQQNTNGDTSGDDGPSTTARDSWQVVQDLYASGGVGAFYEGIAPKLLRAAVFHAVTFWVYDAIMPTIESIMSSVHLPW